MVELARYNRQYILPQIGARGQKRLFDSKIAVIGCGALGCQSSTLLARAGIGNIRIVDRDVVELDNLQRQTLFDERDVGKPKAMIANKKLRSSNSDVKIEGIVDDINFSNVLEFIKDVDVVIDGTDNMETRYLVNDACVKENVPFIYGGAISTFGMTMSIMPKKTACFRCLFPKLPPPGSLPTCETAGILNTVPAVIASIQTTSALRILLGSEFDSNLTLFDAWTNELSQIKVGRREKCPCCSLGHYEFLNAEKKEVITSLCGRNAISINPLKKGNINLKELSRSLKRLGDVKRSASLLIFKLKDYEVTIFSDGRAIIKGTADERKAKSLYSKYVGH